MALVKIRPVTLGGKPAKLYENPIPVGASRGDDTNAARACNPLVQFLLRKFFERRAESSSPRRVEDSHPVHPGGRRQCRGHGFRRIGRGDPLSGGPPTRQGRGRGAPRRGRVPSP